MTLNRDDRVEDTTSSNCQIIQKISVCLSTWCLLCD